MTVQTPREFVTLGLERRGMMHHDATTLSDAFGQGTSIAIETCNLAPGDILNIRVASGAVACGMIELFGLSGLEISVDGDRHLCRPWRAGDSALRTNTGFISNWTIT